MDEGHRSMEQLADLHQNTQPPARGFSTSDSEWLREWGDGLPKMSEPECQLDALRPQNDHTAIANVGLFESDLSA